MTDTTSNDLSADQITEIRKVLNELLEPLDKRLLAITKSKWSCVGVCVGVVVKSLESDGVIDVTICPEIGDKTFHEVAKGYPPGTRCPTKQEMQKALTRKTRLTVGQFFLDIVAFEDSFSPPKGEA